MFDLLCVCEIKPTRSTS